MYIKSGIQNMLLQWKFKTHKYPKRSKHFYADVYIYFEQLDKNSSLIK